SGFDQGAGFGALALVGQSIQVGGRGPPGVPVQAEIVARALIAAKSEERENAGAPSRIPGIQSECRVALASGVLQPSGVAQHVAECEMRARIVRVLPRNRRG